MKQRDKEVKTQYINNSKKESVEEGCTLYLLCWWIPVYCLRIGLWRRERLAICISGSQIIM